jgi:acyl carrier protein
MVIPNSRLELQRQVCQIVAEKLGLDPDKICLDDDVVDDLGADSLALAELTVQLEQRMGVRVPGAAWLDVITVSQLLDVIERHQKS